MSETTDCAHCGEPFEWSANVRHCGIECRFMDHVQTKDGHWLWQGHLSDGYGTFTFLTTR